MGVKATKEWWRESGAVMQNAILLTGSWGLAKLRPCAIWLKQHQDGNISSN